MAFNLQKVLRALLFSSNQPLSVKDVQDIFARFHDQAPATVETDEEAPPLTVTAGASAEPAQNETENETETPAETASETAPAPETVPAQAADEDTPPLDPEAPSLKPPELLEAQSAPVSLPVSAEPEQSELAAQSPEDTDAELYRDVPTLITAVQIREAMDAIAADFRATSDIYMLVEGPSGYRIMTHPRFARWIRIMRDEPPPVKLSQSALETLAVVAYRQPVTRSEIESIRGVSAEAGLNKLMERELVYITGRADLPGRPLQYSTTDKFLEFVGAKSLIELPASDVLSPRQIDAWLQNATKITPPSDAEMGLPLEEGEGESPNLAPVVVEHSTPPFEATTVVEPQPEPAAETPAAEPEQPAPSEHTSPSDQPDQPDQPDQTDAPAEPPSGSEENSPEKTQ